MDKAENFKPDIRIVNEKGQKYARIMLEFNVHGDDAIHGAPTVAPVGTSVHIAYYFYKRQGKWRCSLGHNVEVMNQRLVAIFDQAVDALKDAQEPSIQLGDWFQYARGTHQKVIQINHLHKNRNIIAHCIDRYEHHIVESAYSFNDLKNIKIVSAPTPNLMTSDEVNNRFRPTGSTLKDTKAALQLSIEKWQRIQSWQALLPDDIIMSTGVSTCALCVLCLHKPVICPLGTRATENCAGACCPEYDIACDGIIQPLLDRMRKELVNTQEKIDNSIQTVIVVDGYTYKRVEKET